MKKVNEEMKRKYQVGEVGIAYMKQEDTKGNLKFLNDISQEHWKGMSNYYYMSYCKDSKEDYPYIQFLSIQFLPIEDFLEDVEDKEITPKEITEGILRCAEKTKENRLFWGYDTNKIYPNSIFGNTAPQISSVLTGHQNVFSHINSTDQLKPITESVIDQMTDEFVTENEYRTEDEYMLERIKFNPHKDISTFIDRMPYKWIKWLKNNGYKVD